jgi:hypothetical protein
MIMEGNSKIPKISNFFSYHSSAKWSSRKKEQGDLGDGSCDDPLKESHPTFLGRSY